MTTLIPAYGRNYKSRSEVLADWDAGKDFIIADISSPDDGSYTSKEDWKNGEEVFIRYAKLTKLVRAKGYLCQIAEHPQARTK